MKRSNNNPVEHGFPLSYGSASFFGGTSASPKTAVTNIVIRRTAFLEECLRLHICWASIRFFFFVLQIGFGSYGVAALIHFVSSNPCFCRDYCSWLNTPIAFSGACMDLIKIMQRVVFRFLLLLNKNFTYHNDDESFDEAVVASWWKFCSEKVALLLVFQRLNDFAVSQPPPDVFMT